MTEGGRCLMRLSAGSCDVAIVGAGPAGLAAAIEARRRRLGGGDRARDGSRRHPAPLRAPPFGMREFGRLMSGPAYARRLVGAALRAGADIRTGTRSSPSLRAASHPRFAGRRRGDQAQARAAGHGRARRDPRRPADRRQQAGRRHEHRRVAGPRLSGRAAALLAPGDGRHRARRLLGAPDLPPHRDPPVAMVEAGDSVTARWPAGLLPALLGIPLCAARTRRHPGRDGGRGR